MLIKIGKIIKTVGLKGEFKVYPITEEVELRFKNKNKIWLEDQSVTILSSRIQKGCPIIKVDTCSNIDQAQKLIGCFLYVESDQLPEYEGYYGYELKGFEVNYQNNQVGVVKGFESFGAQMNMRILLNNQKELLVPYIDPFKDYVDVDKKQVGLKNLEGLL